MYDRLLKLISPAVRAPVFKFLLAFFWKTKLDFLFTRVLGAAVLRHNSRYFKDFSENKDLVLVLDKAIFNDDVNALRAHPSRFILLSYPSFLKKIVLDLCWLEEVRSQGAFFSKRRQHQKFFDRISAIFAGVLEILQRRYQRPIKLVLSSIVDYAPDYPWIAAAKSRGVETAVLNKESIICFPDDREKIVSWFRGNGFFYEGDAVFFYNSLSRGLFIEAGVVEKKSAFLTGCPRVDTLLSFSKEIKNSGSFIILASFMMFSYGALRLWSSVLDAVYGDVFLREKTIVKCRNDEEVKELRTKYPDIMIASGPLENYLRRSPAALVSFNSTSCLDALVAGIPVVVPWWEEAKDQPGAFWLVGPHSKNFHFLAENPKELVSILTGLLKKPASYKFNYSPELKEFLVERYSPVDGRNCERVFQAIDKLLHVKGN